MRISHCLNGSIPRLMGTKTIAVDDGVSGTILKKLDDGSDMNSIRIIGAGHAIFLTGFPFKPFHGPLLSFRLNLLFSVSVAAIRASP